MKYACRLLILILVGAISLSSCENVQDTLQDSSEHVEQDNKAVSINEPEAFIEAATPVIPQQEDADEGADVLIAEPEYNSFPFSTPHGLILEQGLSIMQYSSDGRASFYSSIPNDVYDGYVFYEMNDGVLIGHTEGYWMYGGAAILNAKEPAFLDADSVPNDLLYFMNNGLIADQKFQREFTIFYPDMTEYPIQLNFDYGIDLSTREFDAKHFMGKNSMGYQVYPVATDYDTLNDQYIVIYAISPYTDEILKQELLPFFSMDHERYGHLGVAIFDSEGMLKDHFRLDEEIYLQYAYGRYGYPPGTPPSWLYFSEDNPDSIFFYSGDVKSDTIRSIDGLGLFISLVEHTYQIYEMEEVKTFAESVGYQFIKHLYGGWYTPQSFIPIVTVPCPLRVDYSEKGTAVFQSDGELLEMLEGPYLLFGYVVDDENCFLFFYQDSENNQGRFDKQAGIHPFHE